MGRQRAEEIIAVSRELGYSLMRLDTLVGLSAARHLYQTPGFQKSDAYYANPLPDVVYRELELTNG